MVRRAGGWENRLKLRFMSEALLITLDFHTKFQQNWIKIDKVLGATSRNGCVGWWVETLPQPLLTPILLFILDFRTRFHYTGPKLTKKLFGVISAGVVGWAGW